MSVTNIAKVLGDVRIPHDIVNGMLNDSIGELDAGADEILNRLGQDKAFMLRATSMTHDILISTALAQTMAPEAPFETMLAGVSFCGDDPHLRSIGKTMAEKIRAMPRLEDSEIPDDLLNRRFDVVFSAI